MSIGINTQKASSLSSLNFLHKANSAKNGTLEKLSSGLRINKGSDDPAGLLISELLRSQIGGFERALRNTQESNNVLSIAEGGLSSISAMLTNMKSLAIHALNSGITSRDQVSADQAELNSALSTIQRVVDTTNYSGNNLLNGVRDFTYGTDDSAELFNLTGTSIASLSGVAAREIAVDFQGGAENQAERAHVEADFGANVAAQGQEFTVLGNNGARTFSFAAGTGVEDMAEQINNLADSTGVNAFAIRDAGSGATAIRLVSSEYGANAMVRVEQHSGAAFAPAGGLSRDYGQNATLDVNGTSVVTNGLTANVASGDANATIAFNAGSPLATTVAQTGYAADDLVDATTDRTSRLTNISGGMQLQLGEGEGGQNRENISLGNYNPALLGQVVHNGQTYSLNDLYSGGSASLAANPEMAIQVINQAISDVAAGRANIGAYQANALETNANNLMVAIENTTATESSIRDTDMAEAISLFIRNKLLEDANLRTMQSSKMNGNNVLQLLNGLGR
ncbi:MAG: flagellin [Planctomycetota bacterium]|jgi:flagellin|nr:flagellin [Planctomycetota bacterium]